MHSMWTASVQTEPNQSKPTAIHFSFETLKQANIDIDMRIGGARTRIRY